jgi:hypothetical protein
MDYDNDNDPNNINGAYNAYDVMNFSKGISRRQQDVNRGIPKEPITFSIPTTRSNDEQAMNYEAYHLNNMFKMKNSSLNNYLKSMKLKKKHLWK